MDVRFGLLKRCVIQDSVFATTEYKNALGLEDAKSEMIRMEELEQARKEVDKAEGKKPMKQNVFKVV